MYRTYGGAGLLYLVLQNESIASLGPYRMVAHISALRAVWTETIDCCLQSDQRAWRNYASQPPNLRTVSPPTARELLIIAKY